MEGGEALAKEFSGKNGVSFIDSGAIDLDYTQLRITAVNTARRIKWKLRSDLIERWKDAQEGAGELLLVNDSILHLDNSKLSENVAGLVKMTYVPFKGREELPNFLVIPAYQRGPLLRIEEPERSETIKFSWFLRLREAPSAEPEFGLVRVEVCAENEAGAIAQANELSETIARERLPVTYPAINWDKLIFPHKLAEQYVESLFPTRETVRAFFKFA